MDLTPHDPAATELVSRLWAAGCVFAEEEAALLVEAAVAPADLERMLARRVSGVPLEQVLGWARFCGLRIAVAPGVFVPRRRTEALVAEAVRLLRPGSLVVDLCCGSGAVGVALLAAVADIELHAADAAGEAVRCARGNLPTASVHRGDLYAALPDALRGRVDLLACNAPYVPTDAIALMPPEAREHEPRATLDGGRDGLEVLRRVVAGCGAWLAPSGSVLFEVGRAQARAALDMVTGAGLVSRLVLDDAVGATVVVGTVQGRPEGSPTSAVS